MDFGRPKIFAPRTHSLAPPTLLTTGLWAYCLYVGISKSYGVMNLLSNE